MEVSSRRRNSGDNAERPKKKKKRSRRGQKKIVPVKWSEKKRDGAEDGDRRTTWSRLEQGSKRHKKGSSDRHHLFANTTESLRVIAAYHTAEKRMKQIRSDATIREKERTRMLKAIESDVNKLGGLEAYQQASIYGARASKYTCAQTVVPLIRKHLVRRSDRRGEASLGGEASLSDKDTSEAPASTSASASPSSTTVSASKRPFVLDVGAIDNQYVRYEKELDVVPIDLNPQDDGVVRADFFEFAKDMIRRQRLPECAAANRRRRVVDDDDDRAVESADSNGASASRVFDVVVMSLVVNFVGDPRLRGEMLALAAHRHILRVGGLLFVSLPSASLSNSRYMNQDRFQELVCSLGFDLVDVTVSKKIYLATFRLRRYFEGYRLRRRRRRPPSPPSTLGGDDDEWFFRYETEFKRVHVRKGPKRNNFCVMLKNS